MPYKRNFRKQNFRRRPKRKTKADRTKQLVDGKPPGKLEMIAKQYAGPMGTIARSLYGISKLINSEHKFIDSSNTTALSSAGSVILLSGVAQGTTDITRIGNSLIFQDLVFNYDIEASNLVFTTNVRVMLIIDKELDGALPTAANILQAVNVRSPMNMDFSKRFVVLKSKNHAFSLNGSSTVAKKIYVKLPFHGYYDGATAAVGDCKENQILLLLVSDQPTNTPSISYYSRIKFTDS